MNFEAQGQDGRGFLSYYDNDHQLSFVWDSSRDDNALGDRWIDVSFGGAGEPVIARIPWTIILTGPVPGNIAVELLATFARACQAFIALLGDIEKAGKEA